MLSSSARNSTFLLAESEEGVSSRDDLIAISPGGVIHLELLKNISYLSAVSEDTLYRENQVSKSITEHLTGESGYPVDSKQSHLIKEMTIVEYLLSYKKSHFFNLDHIVKSNDLDSETSLDHIRDFLKMKIENDPKLTQEQNLLANYPVGSAQQVQIVSIQPYGFFVDIGLEASGLVHISQIPGPRSSALLNYDQGDWVDVEIVSYSKKHSKFQLKLI